jgi:predicted membrane channel-forming protein YqfA (hemolysin III family)
MHVQGARSEEYAGVNRTIVYTEYSEAPWMGEGTLCWDEQTGLLVEIFVKVGSSYYPSLRLVETNLWSKSLIDRIAADLPFIALAPLSSALQIGLLILLIRKQEPQFKVTRPRAGTILLIIGLLQLMIGTMSFTLFSQTVFSLSFVLGLVFLIVGVLIYSGIWVGTNLKINVGVVLVSLAVVLVGNAAVCAVYREVGALVPSVEVRRAGWTIITETSNLEVVFHYPYAWLASPLLWIGFSLAIAGIFMNFYNPPTDRFRKVSNQSL